jgi:hypothetical protein
LGRDAVVMLSGGCAMTRLSAFVAVVFAESLTCTVKLAAPAVAGVPARMPSALRERPAGKVPALTDH